MNLTTSSIKLLSLTADNGAFKHPDTRLRSLLATQLEQPLGGQSWWFAQKQRVILRLWELQVGAPQVPRGPVLRQAARSSHCLPQYVLCCITIVGAGMC